MSQHRKKMRPQSRRIYVCYVLQRKEGKEMKSTTNQNTSLGGKKWLSVRVYTKKRGSGKGGKALRVGCFNWAPGSRTLRQHQRSDIHQTLLGNIDLCGEVMLPGREKKRQDERERPPPANIVSMSKEELLKPKITYIALHNQRLLASFP